MAGSYTNFTENKILDGLYGNTAISPPATWYLAVSTTTPAEDGTNFTEPVGNGYARVAVTNNATNFPAASGGSKSLSGAFSFPTATPSGWGTVTYAGWFDASSGGNLWGFGPINGGAGVTVSVGTALTFGASPVGFTGTVD